MVNLPLFKLGFPAGLQIINEHKSTSTNSSYSQSKAILSSFSQNYTVMGLSLQVSKQITEAQCPVCTQPAKGSFTNYVDKVLPNIDHLTTPCWHLWLNSFTGIVENMHTTDISATPYLIRLVNVVSEWPLKQGAYRWYYSLLSKIGPKELKIWL